jgi:Dolichyl-phosphate-mannose-protein mannosyltransferase
MPLVDYLVGLAFVCCTVGAAFLVGELITRRRAGYLRGAPRVLAPALLGSAALIAAQLLPALVGAMSRWTALAVALGLAAGASRLPRAPSAAEAPTPRPAAPSGRASWVLAGLALAGLGVYTLAAAWRVSAEPTTDIDSITFHLPNIARWMQSGSVWQVDQFNPLLAPGNYPHNGDILYATFVQAWENDAFVRLLGLPFAALAGLAVYAIGRELRAPRPTAALAAACFAAMPVVPLAATDGAKTDPVMLAAYGTGVLFLLRHWRLGGCFELVLAGLGLGIALGTKWYGVTAVAAVVAVWLAALAGTKRPRREAGRDALLLLGVIALAGGFWLLRNLVESGSPVFPVAVKVLGQTLFDAPRDVIRECVGFRLADYFTDFGVWRHDVYPAYRANYAAPGALVVVGAAGALLRALRGRPAEPRVLALAAASALAALAYLFTPYTAFGAEGDPILIGANTRWLVPALLLAAPLAAWAVGHAGRSRVALEALALLAVTDGVRRGFGADATDVLAAAAVAAAAGALGWGAFALGRELEPAARRAAAGCLALGGLTALVALGHARQEAYNDGRYTSEDPAITWLVENAPDGHRIGLAGVWGTATTSPVWPAFGERIQNEVAFVGPFVDGLLREYDTRAAWAGAVRRGGYDLLVVGRGGYGEGCPVPGRESDDDAWARAEGFTLLERSEHLTVYRVPAASGG